MKGSIEELSNLVALTHHSAHVRLTDWSTSSGKMRYFYSILFILLFLLLPTLTGSAQAPGFAEILEPKGGEAIQGVYTIKGSASHPSFEAYQLSFAYANDPTETWFLLGDRQENQVIEAGLGLWDTTGITDGDYRLRLEVFLENTNVIVAHVEGIRIRNQSPIETSTPAAILAQVTATDLPPTKTPRPTPIPRATSDGASHIQRTFLIGVVIGLFLLSVLSLYLFIRRRARQRWGMLRMRQILRDQNRRHR